MFFGGFKNGKKESSKERRKEKEINNF